MLIKRKQKYIDCTRIPYLRIDNSDKNNNNKLRDYLSNVTIKKKKNHSKKFVSIHVNINILCISHKLIGHIFYFLY